MLQVKNEKNYFFLVSLEKIWNFKGKSCMKLTFFHSYSCIHRPLTDCPVSVYLVPVPVQYAAMSPGLRIPTTLCPETQSIAPPHRHL